MNQTPPPAPDCQVTLTGRRAEGVTEAEFLERLQARFKLPLPQAQSMLRGRVTVKRGVDAAYAAQMAQAFVKIGIEAVVETLPGAAAATPAAATRQPQAAPPAAGAQPPSTPSPTSFQPPKPAPFESPLPVLRPAAAAAATATAVPVAEAAPAQVLESLRALGKQRLPRPKTSSAYMLNLLLVTLLSIALPGFYVALTAAVSLGLAWYLTHIHHYLVMYELHTIFLIPVFYLGPGVLGGALALFLIRPLFLRQPKPPAHVKITTETEPEFVWGVHALCKAIGVAPPREIHATWQVNAWVHFRSGWFSLLTGHKVLTIGMPLVQGLSARSLVGILAHEFGHFAQRSGMTCSFIINSANAWLEHRAFGPDPLEQRLRAVVEDEDSGMFGIIASITLLAIRGVRLMMAGLFRMSVRMSRRMSRQMEFDADRYEALIAGSDIFATTSRNLRALNHAFTEINQANANAWQENRLLRDMPEAIALQFKSFPPERLAAVQAEMANAETRYWDSHPPNLERVQNAEQQQAPGVYLESAPAAQLLRNARVLSEQVTLSFYREQGISYRVDQLRTREEVLGLSEDRDQHRERLHEYFNGQLHPWPLLPLTVPADRTVATMGWQDCINEIRRRSPEITRAWGEAATVEERLPLMRLAVELQLTSKQMGLPGVEVRMPELLRDERQQIVRQDTPYYRYLHEAFGYHARRFDCAIAAMAPAARAKAEDLRRVLVQLQQLGDNLGGVLELGAAARMLGNSLHAESPRHWFQILRKLQEEYAEHALTLLEVADGVAQGVTQEKTLGAYLRARCSNVGTVSKRQPDFVLRVTLPLGHAVQYFYRLALGELVTLCTAAEKARGIKPVRLVPKDFRAGDVLDALEDVPDTEAQ